MKRIAFLRGSTVAPDCNTVLRVLCMKCTPTYTCACIPVSPFPSICHLPTQPSSYPSMYPFIQYLLNAFYDVGTILGPSSQLSLWLHLIPFPKADHCRMTYMLASSIFLNLGENFRIMQTVILLPSAKSMGHMYLSCW